MMLFLFFFLFRFTAHRKIKMIYGCALEVARYLKPFSVSSLTWFLYRPWLKGIFADYCSVLRSHSVRNGYWVMILQIHLDNHSRALSESFVSSHLRQPLAESPPPLEHWLDGEKLSVSLQVLISTGVSISSYRMVSFVPWQNDGWQRGKSMGWTIH